MNEIVVHVWREGVRIRQANGAGYADSTEDVRIIEQALLHLRDGHYHLAAFCGAVLELRVKERGDLFGGAA